MLPDILTFVALILRSNPFDPVDKVSSLYWEPITRTVNCLLCAGEADLCPSHCVWSKSQNSPQDLFPPLVGGGSCIKRKKGLDEEGNLIKHQRLVFSIGRFLKKEICPRQAVCSLCQLSLHISGEGKSAGKSGFLATFQHWKGNRVKVSGSYWLWF